MLKLLRRLALLISIMPSYVLAAVPDIGSVAKTLIVGGDVLTKLMWAACIVVGIALIAASFTQFQIHRRNPKLVPLTTPVLYLLLGIGAIAIPFINTLKTFGDTETKRIERSPAAPNQPPANPNDIDAPIY